MKLNRYSLFLSGIAAMVLTSCSTSIDIAKRQHRPGYYISWGTKTNPVSAIAEKPQQKETAVATPSTPEIESESTASHVEVADGTKKSAPAPSISVVPENDGNKAAVHSKKSERTIIKNLFSKKETKSAQPLGDDGTALWSILSFLFSILGLIPIPISMLVLGLLAIIFGLIGVQQKAKWLAIIGIIAGILEVLVGFVLFSLVLAIF